MLQREYLRTAQRLQVRQILFHFALKSKYRKTFGSYPFICLQRAERLDAVRRHVRSRITQQNQQDQRDPELTSNPCLNLSVLTLNTTKGTTQDVPQCQGHTEGESICKVQIVLLFHCR